MTSVRSSISNRVAAHGGNTTAARRQFALDGPPIIDFSASINPLSMPESVRRVLNDASSHCAAYPEPRSRTLVGALAKLHGAALQNIVVGNGSNELIYLIPRAVRARRGVVLEPAFSEYSRACRAARLRTCRVVSPAADFNMMPVHVAPHSLVWLGHPNNPTGRGWERDELMAWIDSQPYATFVIDEAFMPFCDDEPVQTLGGHAASRTNLIVLRSLTKILAIPGLRLGYLVASAELAGRIRRQQPTWSVNALAQAAGLAALGDLAFIDRTREFVGRARDELFGRLRAIPSIEPFPSEANFLLVRIGRPDRSSAWLREQLARRGFLIRDASNFRGLNSSYFRVAVLDPATNRRLANAIAQALERDE